ncbi:MAG TPA: dethiobiotin synthase [Methylomirabilota bacterium]|nr:dethiobiotin synthase [Methylomirabilota bacterium]
MQRIIVITGTDTGVGKTVLTTLLASHLRAHGFSVAALKPICSGGRDDARVLRGALKNTLTLDEINPWHFRSPLAPMLAARREKRRIDLREVVTHLHTTAQRHQVTLVEGAGGLLSPLGEGFSTRELISALNADVFIAARNQLGVVNHVRLTLESLPPIIASRARIVLMTPRKSDAASRANPGLLAEFMDEAHISVLPWFARVSNYGRLAAEPRVRRTLSALLH